MRLRNKIGAAMAAVTLTGVALTGVLTYLRVSRTIQEEADREIAEASQALIGEWRALGSDVTGRLADVTQLASFRAGLSRLARGQVPAESGEIIDLARRPMQIAGLDFLQVFSEPGRVLSNGHWPVVYGRPDSSGWEIVTRQGSGPVAHWRNVQGKRTLAVETSTRLELADVTFLIVGGRAVTPEVVDDLTGRTGGALYIAMRDGSRIIPEGVAPQDLDHLVGAERSEAGGLSYVVGGPPTGEAVKISVLPMRGPDGTVIGDFVLRISQARLVNLARELSWTFVVIGALGLVMAWIIGFWFARRITRPVEELAAAAARVGVGRSPGRMPEVTNDEVGDLVQSFQRMTSDLSESRRELVRAERLAAWREIAQRMAHEIKNALSPIQISVETIQRSHRAGRPDLAEIVDESVTTVREEVQGLRNLVNEFSQFARMPELALAPAALNPVVERAAGLHGLNPGGIRVETTLDPGLPPVALDGEALGRAIGNILLNAVEANGPGEPVRVTTGMTPEGLVELLVDDRGPGIPAADRDKIFEPYYTTKEAGTGLGLAMAWKIISEHAGRIEIQDSPFGGARFRILLPPIPPGAEAPQAGR